MPDVRADRGRAGEDAALAAYLGRGYRLVVRNWRCPLGELDLVLARAGFIVVCEVKTRSGAAFGGGFDAVTRRKRRKIRQLAAAFLDQSATRPSYVRFDVASVHLGSRGPDVQLFEDAF